MNPISTNRTIRMTTVPSPRSASSVTRLGLYLPGRSLLRWDLQGRALPVGRRLLRLQVVGVLLEAGDQDVLLGDVLLGEGQFVLYLLASLLLPHQHQFALGNHVLEGRHLLDVARLARVALRAQVIEFLRLP